MVSQIQDHGSTPAIDRAAMEDLFVSLLRERWQRGAAAYGDRSFHRPLSETVAQILEEVVDIGGWSLVLFEQARQRLNGIADRTATIADMQQCLDARTDERDALATRLAAIATELRALAGMQLPPTWAEVVASLNRVAALAGREAQA